MKLSDIISLVIISYIIGVVYLFERKKQKNPMLEYFYITNSPDVAKACECAGVNRVFVDMEYIGKDVRQGGLDTVQNHHTVDDVKNIRTVLSKAELLVRVNPIHDHSQQEINDVIHAGADVIMLPMWKTPQDVKTFLDYVDGRAKTLLLLETDEARLCLDEVLELGGFDEIYIGLNDLHLSQHKKFMFELYTDGTVDEIVEKLKAKGIKFGIGGVGKVKDHNLLPAENILCEQYRVGSGMTIISRAFCDWKLHTPQEFEQIMQKGIAENRAFERFLQEQSYEYFAQKHEETKKIIEEILCK